MPTSYTSLLGLALPVTGELSGTWGDTVNDYITQYLDGSVAGTQTISGSQTAVTLSKTTGSSLAQVGSGSTGSSQYSIINCTGNPASLLTITAPAASKPYIIINGTSTSQSVKIVGAGPTTGVTLVSGEKAVVAWNGSDFVKVSSTVGEVTLAGNNAFTGANTFYNATGQTFGTGTSTQDGIIIAGRAGGSSSYRVTLTPTTLTASRTVTLPDANTTIPVATQVLTFSGPTAARTYTLPDSASTLAALATAQTFTATQTFQAANAIRSEAASTQDAIVIAGRAGGTSSYAVTLTPNTLSANRTFTFPDATTTVVGTDTTQTLTNKTIEAGTFTNGYTEEVATANTGTAYTIDLANGSVQILTLTGNATVTMPTATAGRSFLLMLKQDGTGGRTVTWSTVKWPAGTAPTITSTASKMDIFSFFADGTNWYGTTVGQNYTP